MARHGINIFRAFCLAVMAGSFALLTGCAGYAHTTTVVRQSTPVQVEEADRQADEFIGTPIMGDYDNDENLDFVLEVRDSAKVFKLEIHETAGGGNRELLENVRQRVNAMEDAGSIRVIGYYNPEYRGSTKEYGFLDLKMIAFYDEETGKEEAYFTDPQESPYYTESDVTVIYAPGHHFSHIYYPRYVSPWWDSDGDGIPNRYDPWPLSYDTWYDYNMNYIPDWYDPYYVGYYPYWSHWDMNFWVGYHWYSPGYYYRGYSSSVYYHDYSRYTRLYDRKYVNGRDNSGRRLERMDAKSESAWRRAYEQDSRRRTRVADSSPGTRDYRGYESRTPDNRVLSDPSLRTRTTTTTGSDRTITTTSGDNGRETFTRNRVTSGNTTIDRSRDAGRVTTASSGKTKTTVSERTRETSDRATISSRSRNTSSTTNPVYRPTNGRTREITSGRTTTNSSSNRTYRPTSRSRTSTQPAATSSSTRSRSSSSQPAARSSSSRSRSSSSSRPASVSSSSSRSRSSSQPASRSTSGSSRSSSSSARSSSSNSRSRSSSSSSSSSSSRSRN